MRAHPRFLELVEVMARRDGVLVRTVPSPTRNPVARLFIPIWLSDVLPGMAGGRPYVELVPEQSGLMGVWASTFDNGFTRSPGRRWEASLEAAYQWGLAFLRAKEAAQRLRGEDG